ncbi:protease complex subunit PrcB family protein [Niveispirillum sp. KHB5.9]|uniref:protease complex subunit PrcB family protein n=1 Tax=Niveispirillum sp. KHB5.9 TaxID=3400269 RepID=UPI003A8AFF0F
MARRVGRTGVVALVLMAPLVLAGCGGGAGAWLAGETAGGGSGMAGDAPPPLATRAMWRAENARAQSQSFLVARTDAEWTALWDLAGRPPPGRLPPNQMALGVFLGTRTTTGYSVDILRLRPERRDGQHDRLVVEYRELTPPDGLITAQVLTSPYAIIMVDRSDAVVRYNRMP